MTAHLRANALLLGLTFVICSVLYPLAVLGVGQGLFPTRASGSLVAGPDGKPVGSHLIAQGFKGDEWVHPRPSAADHDAAASAGSNLSANNPKLRERAGRIIKARAGQYPVPADAVTASGSGLDPHVTSSNVNGQKDRIVAAWVRKSKKPETEVRVVVEEILHGAAFLPLAGLIGDEALVNVLEVNLELNRRLSPR